MAGHSRQFTPGGLPDNCETHCVSGNRTHDLPIVSPTRYQLCHLSVHLSYISSKLLQRQQYKHCHWCWHYYQFYVENIYRYCIFALEPCWLYTGCRDAAWYVDTSQRWTGRLEGKLGSLRTVANAGLPALSWMKTAVKLLLIVLYVHQNHVSCVFSYFFVIHRLITLYCRWHLSVLFIIEWSVCCLDC